MTSITVVDVNEEAKQEAVEEPAQIEEATEQVEPTNEIVDNPPVEDASPEARELRDSKEEPKQEAKPKAKPKPKPSDRVDCKTCGKNLSHKNYRYRHEKICTAEPKPVKPQAKPKAKSLPKPKIEIKEPPKREILQDISNQVIQPQLTPYDLARQSYIQMKEELRAKKIEKINNFKSKMF